MSKKNFLTMILVLGLAFILKMFSIRICPFFNIFKIPCPGCGLTRATSLLIKGQVIESLKYNPIAFILVAIFIIYFILIIIKKNSTIDSLIYRYKNILIALACILTLIVWIINIHNPLLY